MGDVTKGATIATEETGQRSQMAIGYAAAAWAFVFAGVSFYWAGGGEAGIGTIAANIDEVPLASDPVVVALTGVLKAWAGLLALALVQSWGRVIPRRLLLAGAWAGGILLTIYGLANLIDHGLMVAGIRDTPEVLGERAARWHLLLWDPVWLLGGILFLLAARDFTRRPRPSPASVHSLSVERR